MQSSLRAYFALMLRPASWLALLSRTFTFELALAGSPRANVEYDYVGKQSIPTTGLSPASPTALWAAVPGSTIKPPSGGRSPRNSDPPRVRSQTVHHEAGEFPQASFTAHLANGRAPFLPSG